MIRNCEKKHDWEFLFLGVNIDAAAEAGRMGIAPSHAATYLSDDCGTEVMYRAVASNPDAVHTNGDHRLAASSLLADTARHYETLSCRLVLHFGELSMRLNGRLTAQLRCVFS